MKFRTVTAIAALAMMSGTALASSSDCNEPKDKWMSMDEAKAKAKVISMGYDVRKIKVEDGCYEAYATKDGKKLELYMNPVTAEVVKMKEDD